MSDSIQLRIRHPEGQSTLDTLRSDSTVKDLKREIATLIGAKVTDLVLRAGYPPAPLTAADTTLLSDAEISSGETVIVEVHPQEEAKVEEKPKIEQKPQPKEEPVSKYSTKPVQESTRRNPADAMVEEKPYMQQSTKYTAPTRGATEQVPSYMSKSEASTKNKYPSERSNPVSKPVDKKSSLDELASKYSRDPKPIFGKDNGTKKTETSTKYDLRSETRQAAPAKDPFYGLEHDNVTCFALVLILTRKFRKKRRDSSALRS